MEFKLTKSIPLPRASTGATAATPAPSVSATRTLVKETTWEKRDDGEIVRVSDFAYRKTLKCSRCDNKTELYTCSEGPHLFLCGKCGGDFREVSCEELDPYGNGTLVPDDKWGVGAEGSGSEEGDVTPPAVEPSAPGLTPGRSPLLDRIAQLRLKVSK